MPAGTAGDQLGLAGSVGSGTAVAGPGRPLPIPGDVEDCLLPPRAPPHTCPSKGLSWRTAVAKYARAGEGGLL